MKKIIALIAAMVMIMLSVAGCSSKTTADGTKKETSTIEKVVAKKKLVIGTAPGYLPFEMKDKQGNFLGYDVDLGKAMGEALKVEVEFKQYEFSGLIPALQTGDIDMIIAGMTIRGDRALAVSFSDPYYATGQVIMVPSTDTASTSWQDLDVEGKTIAAAQGTTGALLSKQLFKKAKIVDFADFPTASLAVAQGKADAIIYDEPAIRMYETANTGKVRGLYDLISAENLGIAVAHDDLETVQWMNSFLQAYINSPTELAAKDKWFKSTDWMDSLAK